MSALCTKATYIPVLNTLILSRQHIIYRKWYMFLVCKKIVLFFMWINTQFLLSIYERSTCFCTVHKNNSWTKQRLLYCVETTETLCNKCYLSCWENYANQFWVFSDNLVLAKFTCWNFTDVRKAVGQNAKHLFHWETLAKPRQHQICLWNCKELHVMNGVW